MGNGIEASESLDLFLRNCLDTSTIILLWFQSLYCMSASPAAQESSFKQCELPRVSEALGIPDSSSTSPFSFWATMAAVPAREGYESLVQIDMGLSTN